MLQAAYNVGGHTVNIDMIQNSILGCHLLRPGQVILFPEISINYHYFDLFVFIYWMGVYAPRCVLEFPFIIWLLV